MMGGDDNEARMPLGGGGQDPLLRMHFHDPLSGAKARKAAAPPAKQPPSKKSKLSSAAAAAAAASAKGGKKKGKNDQEMENHGTLLHQSCRLFPQCAPVLESSIEMEGADKGCERAERAGTTSSYLVGDGREPYSLPINILLHHSACAEAVRVVARAAPKALLMKDGRDQDCSLNIALRLGGCRRKRTQDAPDEDDNVMATTLGTSVNTSAPEELLAANPQTAQTPDRRRNLPLHVAAYVGASFTVINKLYYAYPEALLETNFHGETPLDIAIRNGKCSDISTNFLQEKMDHLKSARMRAMCR
ncbi:expressed unknown protein [Seminavis robusta]|uniref:Uncharacterized protein n=1 Tax=Seminavis robusta TaxID=568900 RepID=A0A9N8E673_9STRA|nr:expressed unknown protein [Seminavis robusta]|eukprot:Sro663_g183540.1 n/a (303) ;mRNA; f:37570-38478